MTDPPKRLYLDTNHLIDLYESSDDGASELRTRIQDNEFTLVLGTLHCTDLRKGQYAEQVKLAEQIDALPTLFIADPPSIQFVEAYLAFRRLEDAGVLMMDPVADAYGKCMAHLSSLCSWDVHLQQLASECREVTTFARLFHVVPQWTMAANQIPDQLMGGCFQDIVGETRKMLRQKARQASDLELFETYIEASCRPEFDARVQIGRVKEIDTSLCPTTCVIKRLFVNRYLRDKTITDSDYADLFHAAAIPHVDYYVCERACAGSLLGIPACRGKVFGRVREFLVAVK